MIAALFVETDGCYFGLSDVDPWDEPRDARLYRGPFPVVAHPPCQRWGRYWHGSPVKPHQFQLGDDGGCFASALAAVRRVGGVLEHPADSKAWAFHGITPPVRGAGWSSAGSCGGFTCYVEQGHYGHFARKGTWLYVARVAHPPELDWSRCEQRLPAYAIERYGYKRARRIGAIAAIGGKNKAAIRGRTPLEFRDLLIGIAQSVQGVA